MKKHILLACALFAPLAASAQLNGNGYYRLKNKATGNYATLASDEMSYQKVVDGIGGSNLSGDTDLKLGFPTATGTPNNPSTNGAYPTVIAKMGCYLQNDIRMTKSQLKLISPASVFYLKENDKNDNQYNLMAEGTDLKTITKGQYSASITVDFPGFYTNINPLGKNLYNIYIPVSASTTVKIIFPINATINVGNYYFCDNAGTFGVEKDASGKEEAQWYIEPATTFKVKPLANVKDRSGHYYTTLCVDFPFSIPESGSTVLAAYTVTGQDANGKAVLTKLTGTIAGGTPVILECTSDNEATNVLNIESAEPAEKACKDGQMVESADNYLRGRYFAAPAATYQYKNYLNQVNHPTTVDFKTEGNKLVNDKNYYRVLNCVNGNIGFYKLKDDKANMAANKAFLYIKDLTTVPSSAKTLDIEEASEVTGVKNISAEKHSGAIYDLQGRLVEHPSKHGIYIVDGKKVIIK